MGDWMFASEGDSGYVARLGSGWESGSSQGTQTDDATAGVARRLQGRLDRHLWLLDKVAADMHADSPELTELLDTADRMRSDTERLLLLCGHEPGAWATGPRSLGELLDDAAGLAEEPHRVQVHPVPAATVRSAAAVEFLHVLGELVDHATAAFPGARLELVARIESGGVTVDVLADAAALHDPDESAWRRPAEAAEQLARCSQYGIVLHRPLGGPPPSGAGAIASVQCPPSAVTIPRPSAEPSVTRTSGSGFHKYSDVDPLGSDMLDTDPLDTDPRGAHPVAARPPGTDPLGSDPLGADPLDIGFGDGLGSRQREGLAGLGGTLTGTGLGSLGRTGGWASTQTGSTNGSSTLSSTSLNGSSLDGVNLNGADLNGASGRSDGAYTPSQSSQVDELFGPLIDLPLEPIDDRYATPIFEAIASAWFKEDDRPADSNGPLDWETPHDSEWREAAARAARSEPTPTTTSGLPRRQPGSQLVPAPRTQSTPGPATPMERAPDRIRERLSTYQRGLRQGRHRAPGQDGPEFGDW